MPVTQQTITPLAEQERIRALHQSKTENERAVSRERFNNFRKLQELSYGEKYNIAASRVFEFYKRIVLEEGANVHISVGGLDSITLFIFVNKVLKHVLDDNNIHIKGVSVSSLEDKSIQTVHEQLGIEAIKPYKSKVEVIREFGFPIISKAKASKIERLQKDKNPEQTFIHAIMTGDMGEQGGYGHSDKIKLPDKWLMLFGGLYQEHRPDLPCKTAPFNVSAKCFKWMKELPCDDWAKEQNSFPYLGLMASEGGQREQGLIKNGCNYYGKGVTRSCPFAIFSRQDLLKLALDLNVPVPKIYGEIAKKPDGTLYTTRAQRTGCSMCGFGIHIERRPHRFDRLREDNHKEWAFWMYEMGWGKVLDWIGVEWESPVGQIELEGFI